ncbi:MAG: hypothetical protein PHV13_05960 [Candidatus ainarchaeum sp.]|nr:hypothetical protein [Candidatus ainarchaeum sp.]
MKPVIFILLALLMLGCTGERINGPENATGNATNVTNASVTNATSSYARFTAPSFHFDYPANMEAETAANGYNGVFTGRHQLAERTGEVLAVVYVNTSATYGPNADAQFQIEPTLAANGFLEKDKANDSVGFLSNAAEIGETATFAVGNDVFIAEAPFKMQFSSGTAYSGYAISIYVPERSLQVKVRILALDASVAKQIRDEFLSSFRVQ